ncbi:MAG: nicotinamide mononucleotide transporter [Bacteroidota bacterium]|jgi:nicotinamide mononucleotide transporter
MEYFVTYVQQLTLIGQLELVGVLFASVYLILISFKSKWGWLFSTMSSLTLIYAVYLSRLYFDVVLHSFFIITSLYGWYQWSDDQSLPSKGITKWPLKIHGIAIAICLVISMIMGYAFDRYTQQVSSYMNAFTTVFSMFATFLVARKILENWYYWFVINIVSVFLYYNTELPLMSFMYLFYIVLSIYGYFNWKKIHANP